MTQFRFSERTINLLSNFSSINSSILFRRGNVIRTICPATKSIFAKATIKEDVPSEFAIFDLSRFLSVLSLFQNGVCKFDEHYMLISEKDKNVKYKFAAPSNIIAASEKDLVLQKTFFKFNLSQDVLQEAVKFMNVLNLPEFLFVSEKGNVYIRCGDSEKKIDDTFSIKIGENSEKDFSIIIKSNNINNLLKNENYVVSIGTIEKIGVVHFKGSDVEYIVCSEMNSKISE